MFLVNMGLRGGGSQFLTLVVMFAAIMNFGLNSPVPSHLLCYLSLPSAFLRSVIGGVFGGAEVWIQ